MNMIDISWLLVAAPLASAAILLLAGKRSNSWGHLLGTLAPAVSAVVAIILLIEMLSVPAGLRSGTLTLYSWMPAGDLNVDIGFLIDPLSVTFALLITVVGTLIHVYAIGYMAHDEDRRRFFAYMNLFVAAMLVLVLGNSYAVLFLGWEGVGLASYLLIGFWYQSTDNAVAGNKAFFMNRVGDMGMLVAMMLMFANFGSVNFATVFDLAPQASEGALTATSLVLLLGACGKSAQLPLQAWLGDAMAGPTPVSALIHAATMVTAGVYLVVRSGPIFEGAPTAQLIVVIVGVVTLLFGAIVGCAKDDLKKALAASTMSQIGYMMLAAGLGPIGYAFGIFHLITHGFFKAGLFLGAGSIMHAMRDRIDMRGFGGLRTSMKITWLTFMAGWLAIIGIPPFSGFWSKDKIIEAAFVGDGWQPWVFGTAALVGAGITAFYMSRLFFMTFHGSARYNDGKNDQPGPVQEPHESPAVMTIPMIILAVGSIALGGLLMISDSFTKWLAPVTGAGHAEPVIPVVVIMVATLVLVLVGVFIAWRVFGAVEVPVTAPRGRWLTRAARRDLYQDDVNETIYARPGAELTRVLSLTDEEVIDGAVRGLGTGASGWGRSWQKIQNGFVRSYASIMLVGVVLALAIVLASRI